LLFGNAERAIVEIAHRFAKGEKVQDIKFMRGTAHFIKEIPADFAVKDSTDFDKVGAISPPINPYQEEPACDKSESQNDAEIKITPLIQSSVSISWAIFAIRTSV
jgi:radical SAM superfamily enzyme YgiQ (UPF0313 family)